MLVLQCVVLFLDFTTSSSDRHTDITRTKMESKTKTKKTSELIILGVK